MRVKSSCINSEGVSYKLQAFFLRINCIKEKFSVKCQDENHKMAEDWQSHGKHKIIFLTKARMFMHCLHTKKKSWLSFIL